MKNQKTKSNLHKKSENKVQNSKQELYILYLLQVATGYSVFTEHVCEAAKLLASFHPRQMNWVRH